MNDLKAGMNVTYFPGNDESKKLPNGMTSAPAIITQLFGSPGDSPHANMVVFVADPNGSPFRQEWSVMNKKHPLFQGNEGCPHFDY